MQVGQRFDQSQSDARARSLVAPLGLIVAFEDVWQGVGCDAVAGVSHADAQPSVCSHYGHADGSLFCEFDGVREQVVEDGGDDFRVEVDGWQIVCYAVSELYAWIAEEFLVVQAYFPDKRSQVAACHGESSVLRLRLSEFQYLAGQVVQPLGTLLNHLHLAAAAVSQAAVGGKVVQGAEDERQRCAQFVGNVGEEAQPLLVQLLLLPVLHPCHLQ